jgi:hypothetical protein
LENMITETIQISFIIIINHILFKIFVFKWQIYSCNKIQDFFPNEILFNPIYEK